MLTKMSVFGYMYKAALFCFAAADRTPHWVAGVWGRTQPSAQVSGHGRNGGGGVQDGEPRGTTEDPRQPHHLQVLLVLFNRRSKSNLKRELRVIHTP